MSSLAEKLRLARQFSVTVGGHTYTARRPTDAEALELQSASGVDIVKRFVVGWDHTELSLGIPGGDSTPVPFDAEAWAEWVSDHPEVWEPLARAIIKAYTDHVKTIEAAQKN